ncbi:ImmA/IrrE family metallo-endopeptidase [Brevibacterium sp. ZH18]|uniref:ImmA/IrrE family metallo-endopeptidase n=1 Tax=Brevibacterium sp. ZH18 TaxID=2927784 RepID=UPI001F625BE3|nr:ImmA/IrrE family metallo-endopeptidase [Brevibacterium sp. ZH18]MCI4013030.1 ImmA/IrrE family metallo-endopeptidase [Brevibacterium sp. ZH18]
MAELVYQSARREAKKLLDNCWDGSYPVRLRPFNDELNAEAYAADLGNKLSGVVSKASGQPAKIVLNSRHVDRRNRFTWAHELGHVVERRELAQDDDYSFEELSRGQDYDLHEFFADEFAGSLLMPKDKIEELQRWNYSPIDMAEFFDVSVDAVEKRLKRLTRHPK